MSNWYSNLPNETRKRIIVLPAVLLLAVISIYPFAEATADSPRQTVEFDIDTQSLNSALTQFALQSKLNITYRSRITGQLKSPSVKGRYTPEQALRTLLKDTRLDYRFSGDDTVVLGVPEEQSLSTHLLFAASPMENFMYTASDSEENYKGPIEQEDLTVQGGTWNEYNVLNASTATKTDMPILETPVSIKVLPRAVLDDQGVVRLGDVLQNVSSVQPGIFNAGFVYDTFVIRGFTQGQDTGATIFHDGARLTGFPLVTAGLDRIEVIKGPSSVLYGRVEPGGIVNAVTKIPLPEAHYSLQQQFGSFDLYRTSLDATGPVLVGEPDELLYRFNFDYLDHKSNRDFASEQQFYVAPKIQWNINDQTRLNLNFEYRHQELATGFDNGIPAVGNRPADIPPGRYFGDPTLESFDRDDYLVDFNLSHEFNENWKLAYRGMFTRRNWRYTEVIPLRLDESTGLIDRRLNSHLRPGVADRWLTSLELTGHFETFGINHTLLIGTDYYRETQDSLFGNDNSIPDISLLNPVYGGHIPNYSNISPFASIAEWNGVYVQDQVDITEQLHLLLGGRFDTTEYAAGTPDKAKSSFSGVKPRFGIVYQPQPWLSIYGHYAEALGVSNGVTADDTSIKPQTSEEYEVGLKTELLDGRLSGTLAFFDLTKDNLLTPDPSNPTFSIPIGQARAQGMEIDITGQLTDKLSLIASYAYTDTEITKDNSGNQGNRLPNAPYNSGSLWAKYQLFDHFTLGAGAFAAGQRQVDNANSAQMPGYVRLDAMAAYDWKLGDSRLVAQVNVNNLLDKKYYVGAAFNRSNGITPGMPISVLGTLRLEY